MSEVVIVGGGPVGLGLAIDLAHRGVTSTVLERSTELHSIPKGQNLTQRTGEHFRAWGISNEVRKASPIPPEFGNAGLVAYGNLLSEFTYDWFQRSKVSAFYFAENERLPQYLLEGVLRDKADTCPEISFLEGSRATAISQTGEDVQVAFEGTEGIGTIRSRFCVGCDGARSTTRDLVGIPSDTDHEGPRMALLVFRSKELHEVLERYPGKSIFNVMNPDMDGYWQFLGRVDLDGGWFFHSPVPDGTTLDNFDFAGLLHRFLGKKFKLEFEHIGFWDLRITQAKHYRKGQVFIAGDACHSHPPYGGYGINTGTEDACNLSWKIAAELQGWAGKSLLDSYEAERHPVFKSVNEDFISRMIEDFRDFTESVNPTQDLTAFRTAWHKRATADDSDVTQFLPNYAGSPIVLNAPGTQSSAKGQHLVAARPGHHLSPQPLPNGSDLWDALGTGFTLLNLDGNVERSHAFSAAADRLGVPFKTVELIDPLLLEAYGQKAVLVRPDQFIAWVADGQIDDPNTILRQATGH